MYERLDLVGSIRFIKRRFKGAITCFNDLRNILQMKKIVNEISIGKIRLVLPYTLKNIPFLEHFFSSKKINN